MIFWDSSCFRFHTRGLCCVARKIQDIEILQAILQPSLSNIREKVLHDFFPNKVSLGNGISLQYFGPRICGELIKGLHCLNIGLGPAANLCYVDCQLVLFNLTTEY